MDFIKEILDFFLHLDEHLSQLIQQYGVMVYLILFLIIFVETGLVVMPFLPGDSLLFTAGLFARHGDLDLGILLVLLFAAAVLGDNTNYWIGRKLGLRVFRWKFRGKPLVKQKYLDQTHAFYEKHGPKAIIMARFVPIVRTFAPFVAGVAEMKYRKFVSFDILGGALWIGGLTMAGYLLGEVKIIRENIDLVCIGIVLVSVLPMLIKFLQSRSQKKKAA